MRILAVEMNLSKHVTKIDFNSMKDKFTISTNQEQIDEAEAVIITVPVPQVLTQLKGSISQLIGKISSFIIILIDILDYSKMIIRISKRD